VALITQEDGEFLVRLARRSVEHFLSTGRMLPPPKDVPPAVRKEMGAFTTILSFPSHALRGCIGYPLPIKPLYQAVIETAVLAASDDPRFPPLSPDELDSVVFEVSVLTPPKKLDVPREELPKHIVVGRHGLIIRRGYASGLLLPQVAVEEGWDSETFLDHCCLKAGLYPGCWREKGTEVYVFEAEVFSEIEPRGPVVKKLTVKP